MGTSKRDIATEGHFIKKDKRQLKRFRRRQSERYEIGDRQSFRRKINGEMC